jgi:hypothetical protein
MVSTVLEQHHMSASKPAHLPPCAGVFLQAKVIIGSPLLPLLFAAAYAVLAWQAWQGGSLALVQDVLHAAKPWPDASLLAAMFQDRALAALAWLHLLMLDFLTARCGSSSRNLLDSQTGTAAAHAVSMQDPLQLLGR